MPSTQAPERAEAAPASAAKPNAPKRLAKQVGSASAFSFPALAGGAASAQRERQRGTQILAEFCLVGFSGSGAT